jgi:hypothetical protein
MASIFEPAVGAQMHEEDLDEALQRWIPRRSVGTGSDCAAKPRPQELRPTDASDSATQEPSAGLICDFLSQLEATAEPPGHECYICGNSEALEVRRLACGHALCQQCLQCQVQHLPKPGEKFSTRNAKCGICSSWIVYEDAPKEFSAIKEREDALVQRLAADNDPDPELPELLRSGTLLSKWQFMICA